MSEAFELRLTGIQIAATRNIRAVNFAKTKERNDEKAA